MFIKRFSRTIKSTGDQKIFYRLVESYRFDNGLRHQTILHLGTLDELPDIEQKRNLAIRLNALVRQSYTGEQDLFKPSDKVVEALAQKYFQQIKDKERLDIAAGKDYRRIDTDSIKNKNVRETGADPIAIGWLTG